AVDIVPATVVAGGKAEFGISWVPRMLAPRESGADVQVIGQVFQRSATTQVAFKTSGISSVADFKGKKIGSWGFGNEFELLAGMRKAGLNPDKDVTIVPQQFDMHDFVAGAQVHSGQCRVRSDLDMIERDREDGPCRFRRPRQDLERLEGVEGCSPRQCVPA